MYRQFCFSSHPKQNIFMAFQTNELTLNVSVELQPLLKNHVSNCPKIWETDYGGKNSW